MRGEDGAKLKISNSARHCGDSSYRLYLFALHVPNKLFSTRKPFVSRSGFRLLFVTRRADRTDTPTSKRKTSGQQIEVEVVLRRRPTGTLEYVKDTISKDSKQVTE
jgi:hypothetical protein